MALVLLFVLLLQWQTTFSKDIFFDNYGHCSRKEPFDLMSESHVLRSVGGDFNHERLKCKLMFRAPPSCGVCLKFIKFNIEDCGVVLVLYKGSSSHESLLWKNLSCKDSSPEEMCTSDPYVEVNVIKKRLNKNKGYTFEINVERSNTASEGGVVAASLSLIIGIPIAVLVGAVGLGLTICWCCRRRQHHTAQEEPVQEKQTFNNVDRPHPEPSAPPAEDTELLNITYQSCQDPPPAYSLYPENNNPI